jgi:hypothetical protein
VRPRHWTQLGGLRANDGDRISAVHQDQPTDNGVEWSSGGRITDVAGDKANIAQSKLIGPRGRHFDGVVGPLDTQHAAGLSHEVRNHEGHIPGARPKIKDSHPGTNACARQEHSCSRRQQSPLQLKPLQLWRGVPELIRVAGVLRHDRSLPSPRGPKPSM